MDSSPLSPSRAQQPRAGCGMQRISCSTHVPFPVFPAQPEGPRSVTGAVTGPAWPSQAVTPPQALRLQHCPFGEHLPVPREWHKLEVALHPSLGVTGAGGEGVSHRNVLGEPHWVWVSPVSPNSSTQQPGDTTSRERGGGGVWAEEQQQDEVTGRWSPALRCPGVT